jgi:hypothetical protein
MDKGPTARNQRPDVTPDVHPISIEIGALARLGPFGVGVRTRSKRRETGSAVQSDWPFEKLLPLGSTFPVGAATMSSLDDATRRPLMKVFACLANREIPIRLPKALEAKADKIDALYQFEVLAAPRGKRWFLSRRGGLTRLPHPLSARDAFRLQ